jgi:hypothetical protein
MRQSISRTNPMAVRISFDRSLLNPPEELDHLQTVLNGELVEVEREGAEIKPYRKPGVPVLFNESGSLRVGVLQEISKRGPLYYRLKERYGAPYERLTGSVRIQSTWRSFEISLSLDEYSFARSGDEWLFGNSVWIRWDNQRVAGVSAWERAAHLLSRLCEELSPAHASVAIESEYDAKNLNSDASGTYAIGLDVSASLPGLYWLNFFGNTCTSFIGKDKLTSAPAREVRDLDNGVFIRIGNDPRDWLTPEYRAREEDVLEHIGRQFFFDRRNPSRKMVSPWAYLCAERQRHAVE